MRITNPYRQAPLWAAGTDPERLDIVERSFYAVAQSSPTRHVLASGPVNSGQVKVELVTPSGKPPFVVVTWPLKPSAMSPAAYSDAAAQLCRPFAAASVGLSQRRAWETETPGLGACRSGPSWPELLAIRRNRDVYPRPKRWSPMATAGSDQRNMSAYDTTRRL